jgi:glucose-1-phosphate cytidylyltransferase
VCLGYKGYVIKEYFSNYYRHTSDLKIDLKTGDFSIINSKSEDWTVTLIDTGLETMTGGRLKRARSHLDEETFCLTYGDGLADIDIGREIEFHRSHGKLATVAAVKPPGRFGVLDLDERGDVRQIQEKPSNEFGWINGGYFVLERAALDRIAGDSTSWELEPLSQLAAQGQLVAFRHEGFWKPCDTLRDKRELEALWSGGAPPWRLRP